MAQRVSYSFKESAADIISAAGKTRLGRVQRAEVGANLPNTPVQELGSDKLVGRIFDIPEVSVTIAAIDVGARTSFALAGKDWATAASGEYIEAQDIKYVAISQPFKAPGASDEVARTLFVPAAKLERFSLNYSVGGDATEEYSFQGTTSRWLKYDVATQAGTVTAGAVGGYTGARALKNGNYFLSVFASGLGYVPNESILTSTATGITVDTDIVPNGTPVVIAYHKDLTNDWAYTHEFANIEAGYTPAPDQPVGVRGWGVEVFLVASGVTSERVYRAQTCTVQAQFQTTKVQELGNEDIVGYSDGIPDVTGTLEVMQHDFRLAEILSGDTTGDNWAPAELDGGGFGLLVKVWRRNADRVNTQPEKTVWLPAIEITQQQNNAQVGQDAKQTFNFASQTNQVYIFKGDKPASFWGR
jgi:hypothetical protein